MALELLKQDQNSYTPAFRDFLDTRAANEPAWLRLRREQAFAHFENIGLPTVKDEDWKYTNVAPIAKASFVPTFETARPVELPYAETRESTLGFVNGYFSEEHSSLQALSSVRIIPFAAALASPELEPIIRQHYERKKDLDGFIALNTAFSEGVLIVIPSGTKIEAPIHLAFVTAAEGAVSFGRVLIVAEANSTATVVESYSGDGKYLTNGVIDFLVNDGAHLLHYKIQRESADAFHIADTSAELGASANYDTTTINFGAAISRHGIDVRMDHEGAQCSVDGLYMVDGNQHTDTHSLIDHRQPRCASHQLYKGILDGKSRAVFNGKVFVRHGAQQTDAKQTNKNLLLSPEARVDTKPQLEIFADDVKCAHGAAVGQLDLDELFYLESRGINSSLARNMLTYGFAEEVIEKIRIESIKRELDEAVLHRLHSVLELE
ncbi:MAG TPA: Fe-S cluster assembly protein SufD [Pyrinomonadaceae bacterium]|nr:Fe-S cluster assembly protein SufD [Pyrinomonadaceae bacterium]